MTDNLITSIDTLQRQNTKNLKQIFPEKDTASVPVSHSCVCEQFIYSHDWSAYSAAGKYVADHGHI
jgi:hypothetical protein